MKKLRAKKYFFRLFAGIGCVLLAFAVVLITGTYMNIRSYVTANETRRNELLLSQVEYSLAQLDEGIRDLCTSLYYSPDVQVLMYQQAADNYDTMLRLNRIKSFTKRKADCLQSVYVINSQKDVLYSTFRNYIAEDESCQDILSGHASAPILRPVLRTWSDPVTGETQPVLSYFLYEITDQEHRIQNGVVANVDMGKFFESLQHLNKSIGGKDIIYIYSIPEQQFLSAAPNNAQTPEMDAIETFLSNYDETKLPWECTSKSLTIDGVEHTLTYKYWKDTGWVLLQAQADMTLNEYLREISASLLTITAAALVIAALAYYFVSRRLYSPVRDLVRLLPQGATKSENDEFLAIRQALEQYQHDNAALSSMQQQYIASSRGLILRQIIIDSASFDANRLAQLCDEHALAVDLTQPVRLCLVELKHYRQLLQNNALQDIELLKYAIQNISHEIMGMYLESEYIDMGHNYSLFLLEDTPDAASGLDLAARKIQQSCHELLNVSLCFAFSDPIPNRRLLYSTYQQLRQQIKYGLLLGWDVPIDAQKLSGLALSGDVQKVTLLEDDLLKNLHLDSGILQIKLHELIRSLYSLRYEYIVYAVMRLQEQLIALVQPEAASQAPLLDAYSFENTAMPQIEEKLWSLVLLARSAGAAGISGGDDLSFSAKEIIDAQYADTNLNAAYIADRLGISAPTLSRVFKKGLHMTVPEYLNLVRLNHAVELMQQSELSISDVMRQVGFESESNFYRLFKKTYHMTPREYLRSQAEHSEPMTRV